MAGMRLWSGCVRPVGLHAGAQPPTVPAQPDGHFPGSGDRNSAERMEAAVREVVRQMRRIGLVVAGVGSVMLGLLVAWAFVKPGVIGGVGTGALVAIFGLLVLPPVVYWVWTVDRRAAVRQAARMRSLAASGRPAAMVEGLGLVSVRAPGRDAAPAHMVGHAAGHVDGHVAGHVVIHEPIRVGDGRRERSHRATARTVHVG